MDNKNKFVYICLLLFALLGVFVRAKLYFMNCSFWLDENSLYVAIKENRNYFELLFPLSFMQMAPPLFLMIERFIILHIGIGELVLRLYPFICSLISIPVFYIFSKIFLRKNLSVIIANFLFAINVQLIHYAQVFKQYSSDVLIFMLVFIILNNLSIKRFEKKEFIYYSLVTTISPLLALPSYFVIAGWFLRELLVNNFKYIKKLFVANIFCIVITFAYYIPMLFYQKYVVFSGLFNYWKKGFLSFDVVQDIKLFAENMYYFFLPCFYYVLACLLVILGTILLLKQIREKENVLLFCSIIFILFLSLIHVYPIIDRVCLYTLPFVLVLMTKCCDFVSLKHKLYSVVILIIFTAFFCRYNLIDIIVKYKPWYAEDARSTMVELISNYKPNDIILVNSPSRSDYIYYKDYYKFSPKKEIMMPYTYTLSDFMKEIENSTQKGKRYFFYFSNDYTDYEKAAIEEWVKKQKIIFKKDFKNSKLWYLEKK